MLRIDIGCRLQGMWAAMGSISPRVIGGRQCGKYTESPMPEFHQGIHMKGAIAWCRIAHGGVGFGDTQNMLVAFVIL